MDAVCVAAERAAELARAVDADWPEPDLGELALDLALVEGWETWDAARPVWTGGGRELLDRVPPAVRVVGLWWDWQPLQAPRHHLRRSPLTALSWLSDVTSVTFSTRP